MSGLVVESEVAVSPHRFRLVKPYRGWRSAKLTESRPWDRVNLRRKRNKFAAASRRRNRPTS